MPGFWNSYSRRWTLSQSRPIMMCSTWALLQGSCRTLACIAILLDPWQGSGQDGNSFSVSSFLKKFSITGTKPTKDGCDNTSSNHHCFSFPCRYVVSWDFFGELQLMWSGLTVSRRVVCLLLLLQEATSSWDHCSFSQNLHNNPLIISISCEILVFQERKRGTYILERYSAWSVNASFISSLL